MRTDFRRSSTGLRAFALACIAVLGLLALIGSGGGGLGFPPCGPPLCGPPAPPTPSASIKPPYITAQVGTAVSYTAESSDLSGTLSYQWRRSPDGGSSFVDIPGATGRTYALASVNLADDGALFVVTVRGSNGSVLSSRGHLTVSATPGIVFADGEFQPTDWIVSPLPDPGQIAFVHTDERLTLGGNQGAFRKMVFQVPQGAGSARLFYALRAAVYDPASQGAIVVIDYAEDCIALQASETTYTDSTLVIEQAGRRYLADLSSTCVSTSWSTVAGRASLRVQDFVFVDGPACTTGASCLDFSASAPPLRFGYRRIAFGTAGDVIAHGIDNWKVTVWRR